MSKLIHPSQSTASAALKAAPARLLSGFDSRSSRSRSFSGWSRSRHFSGGSRSRSDFNRRFFLLCTSDEGQSQHQCAESYFCVHERHPKFELIVSTEQIAASIATLTAIAVKNSKVFISRLKQARVNPRNVAGKITQHSRIIHARIHVSLTSQPQRPCFSRSRISSSSTSCREGGAGGGGTCSCLRRIRLITLIAKKIANATMTKSNSVCKNAP